MHWSRLRHPLQLDSIEDIRVLARLIQREVLYRLSRIRRTAIAPDRDDEWPGAISDPCYQLAETGLCSAVESRGDIPRTHVGVYIQETSIVDPLSFDFRADSGRLSPERRHAFPLRRTARAEDAYVFRFS